MRLFPRPARIQRRLGNVLADVSGEVRTPPQLAGGTGAHKSVDESRGARVEAIEAI